MTKQDLIRDVAGQTGLKNDTVREVVEATIASIKGSVAHGEAVFLRGFGTFTQKHRAEKKARNISKGTTVIVPAHEVPYFKPSKDFELYTETMQEKSETNF